MLAGALHGLTQAFARHALPAGMALGRNHYHRGTAIAGDGDGLPLRSFHHFAEPVLGFQGGYGFHGSHNGYSGCNGQVLDEALILGTRVAVIAYRPGRIREYRPVDLPWPRDITSPAFNEMKLS